MAVVDLKKVHRTVSKGRVYYYAWRGKGAPRLHAKPGTAAFVQELAEALASRGGEEGKVARLVADYRGSDDWRNLADKTKRNWSPWLDRIRATFGKLSVATFDNPAIKRRIRHWLDGYKAHPRTADVGKQVLSRVMGFALARGQLSNNPCAGIPNLYDVDRSELIWTPADIAELEKHASQEIMWAVHLAALTGLRQGDLLRLSWSHVGTLAIEIRTGKSGGKRTALIPLYDELRAFLDTLPKRATTVLTNSHGRPWRGGFTSSFGKAKAAAGIKELHFHDLRGTFATRAYAADLNIREIAELLGWSEDQVERIINRYVKRDEILRDRIRRLDRERERNGNLYNLGTTGGSNDG